MDQQTYLKEITKAVSFFWKSKQKQLATSVDKSNRGAVVGGKQMDGFISLLKKVAENSGVPRSCIYTKNNYLPGFFRSSKNWDFLVISPSKKLIAAIELKSQIGSYGNNFNNRTEEAIGSAVDLWTAYRENQFPNQQAPWVGYIMVVGKDIGSTTPVKNNELIYPVLPEFGKASYIDRYRILCKKLKLERHYTSTALLWTSSEKKYGDVAEDISLNSFLNFFAAHLKGSADEFK
ncbi:MULTISPECIES: PaeR7I family type II restriction endonuclease [Hallerella]|uniref:Restriction endonuclease XhoI n=1 Tax=Hallerella succinigenes TaxID=1896222 RepID=A0A2M9A7H1_9BACT|nr:MULTISPECIES: PaeR7I family type II restriction endonuclease [Hallerella]MCI6872739.1 PaeR7I family type II restriction endonuclease [Hallerella sp.]PJJ41652.1 restriction endonuclease XhoI [Hallerella succinigenes]